jgi:hypothetical protein
MRWITVALIVGCTTHHPPRELSPEERKARQDATDAVRLEQAVAAQKSAQLLADQQQAKMAALNLDADTAQKKRAKTIRKHFPAKENVLETCIAEKGGPKQLSPDFRFGSDISIAYQLQLGNEALAQRFLNYIEAASNCTGFGWTKVERALIPALSHLRNTAEIGTLIAVAGDICAQKAENTNECFLSTVQTLTGILE